MKFETVQIYLVKWRFWFVVWSQNFATLPSGVKTLIIYILRNTHQKVVVNFDTQMSSSQSDEWTMVFTREEKWYAQSESRKMFFHMWEKWYVQSEATEVCEFRA